MRPDLILLFSAAILSACDLSLETDEINSSQHPISFVQALGHDIDLDCSIDERAAPSSTVVTLSLSTGDMLWVAADSTVEYLEYPDGVLSGDLAQTYLACAPGTATDETPSTSAIVARGGQNLWQENGSGNLIDIHHKRAIYTATSTGPHTCWVVHECRDIGSGEPGAIRFTTDSFMKYYTPNQYPGRSWKQGDDVAVMSESTFTAQLETWDSNQLTASDSELVALWSPHITNCTERDTDPGGDCEGMHFEEGTTSFDWRLVVYQQNGATTCNKAFGNWAAVECNQINHHCGVLLYQDTFPIITGVGTDGNCGPASADRRFKTYAQLRKSADTGYSDVLAHGGTYANLTVYSR